MDLKGIMLSKISHTEKHKYCPSHLYVESINFKVIETESGSMVTRGWGDGVGNGEMLVKKYKLSVIR